MRACAASGVEAQAQAVQRPQPGAAAPAVAVGAGQRPDGQRDPGPPQRLGRERPRAAADQLEPQQIALAVDEEVEGDARPEPARADAEPRVADRVGGAAVERGAERDAEARARVDDAAPVVGEADALELGNVAKKCSASSLAVLSRCSSSGATRLPKW